MIFFLFHIEIEGKGGGLLEGSKGMLVPPSQIIGGRGGGGGGSQHMRKNDTSAFSRCVNLGFSGRFLDASV